MSEDNSITYCPVKDFPGYRVGDDGSVWTAWRTCRSGSKISSQWRRMTPGIQKRGGYRYVNLRRDGKSFTFRVHRLVLEAFVGPRPDGMEARHFPDRDKANNRRDNLAWGTPEENRQDNHEQEVYAHGSAHSQAKLTEADVLAIRARYAAGGILLRELAQEFGVAIITIHCIVHRKSWGHLN